MCTRCGTEGTLHSEDAVSFRSVRARSRARSRVSRVRVPATSSALQGAAKPASPAGGVDHGGLPAVPFRGPRLRRTDILPRLNSWGSTVTDRAHDGEVPHSPTAGLWAVPVRPPTEIAGFIYPREGCVSLRSIRRFTSVTALKQFGLRFFQFAFRVSRLRSGWQSTCSSTLSRPGSTSTRRP